MKPGPSPKKKMRTLKELQAFFAERIMQKRQAERSLAVRNSTPQPR